MDSLTQNGVENPKSELNNISIPSDNRAICDVSDSENEDKFSDTDTETICENINDAESDLPLGSIGTTATMSLPFMQIQFPRTTRYYFPASLSTLDSQSGSTLDLCPSNLASQIRLESEMVDTTISHMTQDLKRFSTSRLSDNLSPHEPFANSLRQKSRQDENSSRLVTNRSDSPCTSTSISMLVHESMMSNRPGTSNYRTFTTTNSRKLKERTRFTITQRMQEELYESLGEKPNNLADENRLLYQTIDFERKKLILRKGLCSFTYAALKRQSERVGILQSRHKVQKEECAARIILNSLLLNSYRRIQTQVNQLLEENSRLQKSVENLCLQLRVIRHLQTGEKEKAIEKAQEIGTLKSEIGFVKKVLVKTKSELAQVGRECEAVQSQNEKMAEEKLNFQRELRSLEHKKEVFEGNIEIERRRAEKFATETMGLKRQMSEFKTKVIELTTQCDQWQEKFREIESKNLELQLLHDSRGKELIEMGKNRDSFKTQADGVKLLNAELELQNDSLETQINVQVKYSKKVTKGLKEVEFQLQQQTSRIQYLQDEIKQMECRSQLMRIELSDHKLRNIRKRRAWVQLAMTLADPFGTFLRYFFSGSNQDQFVTWN